jgi:membrane fusion protein YbhG
VHEGDRVTVGETLAVVDRSELDARLAQARAALTAARALLTEMERGPRSEELAQARAADSAAAARLSDAQRDLDRTQRLLQGGAVSQEAFDKAALALDMARSAKAETDQQLELVQSGPREERIAAQRALVAQAAAAVRQADATLDNAVVTAPFDGVVTVRHREPGETVAAGTPVLTVVNLADRWVRVYISESRIGAVRLGEPATIASDTYRGKQYAGTVSFIASEAEFTPRNVQTTEERVKLVYAVKVRISGDPANDLKPGMPADVVLGVSGASR